MFVSDVVQDSQNNRMPQMGSAGRPDVHTVVHYYSGSFCLLREKMPEILRRSQEDPVQKI